MSTVEKYFRLARKTALKGDSKEAKRSYRLGAVGIRSDGTIVASSNISHRTPEPQAHAEARVVKKLDWGGVVYVVRIQSNGKLAIARPCKKCQSAMRLRGVRRCYYSVSENEYGVLEL
jgi:tRNA(Arg) A34 adenosine deaminase TadA